MKPELERKFAFVNNGKLVFPRSKAEMTKEKKQGFADTADVLPFKLVNDKVDIKGYSKEGADSINLENMDNFESVKVR
jgi:hypothetical protein